MALLALAHMERKKKRGHPFDPLANGKRRTECVKVGNFKTTSYRKKERKKKES